MEPMKLDGWQVIDEKAGVAWREYSFGRGLATTFVFRARDGLAVVSPGVGLASRDYDALGELGEVTALIANNSFHNLGQKPWRERFPAARSFCPEGAMASLRKKVPGTTLEPLSALALPEAVQCTEMPGHRGETFVSVKTRQGCAWYVGDVITNFQKVPPPPLRWLFTWTDSGPGYRLFRPNAWIFVKDRPRLREWGLGRVAECPPTTVVSAHGPAFEAPDLAELTARQLERL